MADKVNRIRGRALQALRAAYFAQYPLCAMCRAKGRVTVATEIDHIQALTNGGDNEWDNYQGLCSTCHEIKTYIDIGYKPRATIGEDGWPIVDASPVPRWRLAERGKITKGDGR